MSKWYAIRAGYDKEKNQEVKGVILRSWAEAAPLVQGVNKSKHGVAPEYKSFKSEDEAERYLIEGNPLNAEYTGDKKPYLVKGIDHVSKNALHCYIDGSYHEELNNYSFGLVCVFEDVILHQEGGIGNNPEAVKMQQVGGELLGAIKALLYAKLNRAKHVVIFFDYKGIAHHALGTWKRTNKLSKTYYEWMQKFFKENPGIKVEFCKVDAHTGDDFNEIADGLAKEALGIRPDPVFYRMINKHVKQ